MKKKQIKKISLRRETIRKLSDAQMDKPAGRGATAGANCNGTTLYTCDNKCTR